MSTSLHFFHELRRFAGKLSSEVAQLKRDVQSAAAPLTKTETNAALAPMLARLAYQEDEIMKCKENYMGADDAPKATTAQICAAASELLAAQSAAFAQLEAYLAPFGLKQGKGKAPTVPTGRGAGAPAAQPSVLAAAYVDDQDENVENTVVSAPVAAPAPREPSPVRLPSLDDEEEEQTPTLDTIGLSAEAQAELAKAAGIHRSASKPAVRPAPARAAKAAVAAAAAAGKPGRKSHTSQSSTEPTPEMPSGLVTTAVTPAASRAQIAKQDLFDCPVTPGSPALPVDLLHKFTSPAPPPRSTGKKRRSFATPSLSTPTLSIKRPNTRSASKAQQDDLPHGAIPPIDDDEWSACEDRLKSGISLPAVNAAIDQMNEWVEEQNALLVGTAKCDVITTVDLEDEVGIDEESIAPFTALLISFNRFVALGRGKFRIPY